MNNKKYKNGSIYLSGGMQHAKDLGAGWRLKCAKELRKMGYYPLDITALDIAYTKAHGELYIPDGNTNDLQRRSDIRRHFIHSDLQLILNDSDALIVLYDESARLGAGTISECQYAYEHNIPIFIVSAYEDWRKEVPGWLYGLSSKVFTNFTDLYIYLSGLPEGILLEDDYGNRHAKGKYYLCSLCGDHFEKNKQQFVSKVSPLYCTECVDVVKYTYEQRYDRAKFFKEYLKDTKG